MKSDRWGRIGELFHAAASLPPSTRADWLRDTCGDDERLRTEVEYLLDHDAVADREGFLDAPEIENPEPGVTGTWLPDGEHRNLENDLPPRPGAAHDAGSDGFSPKPAITSSQMQRSEEETRSVVQSRLRVLPLIHILIFGTMLLLRPVVIIGSVSLAMLASFGVVAAAFAGLAILLATRSLSLVWLRRIEMGMTLALGGLLIVYECGAIIDPAVESERIRAEKVIKNEDLLIMILMIVEAIYVPKSWIRAAITSSSLAVLPLSTLAVVYLIDPESVRWVGAAAARRHQARGGLLRRYRLPAHLGRDLYIRGLDDLAASVAGDRGAAFRPVPPPRAARGRGDG